MFESKHKKTESSPQAAQKTTSQPPLVRVTPANRLVSRPVFWGICAVCVLIIAAAAGWSIPTAEGPVVLGDELGYWGNAAILTGHNWHDIMQTIPFYAYGYSLLLVPLFLLGLPMATMYQVALGLNVVFLLLAFMLTYQCLRQLFSTLPPVGALLVACATTLYTNNLIQAQAGWTETLLYLLFWLLFWQLLRQMDHPSIPGSLALAVEAGYLYMVHMRTIGVLIALVITVLLLWAIHRMNWKQVLTFFLAFVGMLVLQNTLKLWFNGNVYTSADLVGVNDYSSQVVNMFDAFSTPEGLLQLLQSACGKLFYVGAATLLLGFAALRTLLVDSVSALWRWVTSRFSDFPLRKLPAVYLLLSCGGAWLINVISMRTSWRLDMLIYGRYMEFVFGPLIAVGLALLVLGRVGLGQAVCCGGALLLLAMGTNTSLVQLQNDGIELFLGYNITTLQVLTEWYDQPVQLTYMIAALATAVFLLLWGSHHAFARFIQLEEADLYKVPRLKLRGVLRVLCPVLLASAVWVGLSLGSSAVLHQRETLRQVLSPYTGLIEQSGVTPTHFVYVGSGTGDELRHLQLRYPDAVMEYMTEAEFKAAELDPEAWYLPSVQGYAAGVVGERCTCVIEGVYVVPQSHWYTDALHMVLPFGTVDHGYVSYGSAAECPEEVEQVDVTPYYTQRDDGFYETHIPLDITSNGEEGSIALCQLDQLPAGTYEISVTLTLQAGQEEFGALQLIGIGGNLLAEQKLSANEIAPGHPVRWVMRATTALDELWNGAQLNVTVKEGVELTLHEISYARVGEATEVLPEGALELDQLARLVALDPDGLPVRVLLQPTQLERASVRDLQTSCRGHAIQLVSDPGTVRDTPAILLVPTVRQSLIYQLLGSHCIAERLGDYTVLLPKDSGLAAEFVAQGGKLLSDGYSIELRYYSSYIQAAGTVTATPPAGTYYVVAQPRFSHALIHNYGSMTLTLDGESLSSVPLNVKGSDENAIFYVPMTVTLDGTQSLSVAVQSNLNAELQELSVLLRRVGDVSTTYGDMP